MSDLTKYMETLSAGAPRFGAWFRSDKYKIDVDFGAKPASSEPPLEGLRITPTVSGTDKLGFCAPFNGFVQFATPQSVSLEYRVTGEAARQETLFDPTLRGLRCLDGSPFRPRRQIGTTNVPGYVMLFTVFPHAYLRLKRLFQELEHGSSATKSALRPIPYRFAIVFYDKDHFTKGFAGMSSLLQDPLSGALGLLKKAKLVSGTCELPKVDLERSAVDGKIGAAPRYYVKAGAQVMQAQKDWTFDLYVFDEEGWPVDPVYAWHVLQEIDTKFTGVQQGKESSTNPLESNALSGRLPGSGKKERLFLHVIDLHGGPAPPYLSKALKVGPSGQYTLEALGTGAAPPLRKVTLAAATGTSPRETGTIEFDTSALKLSESESAVALGLYPNGALQESSPKVEHQALDYDFLRLVLVDLTHHVGRNQPGRVDQTAKEAFPKTGTLRKHKKDTTVSLLGDGKKVVGAIDAQLKRAAESGVSERLVRLMTPQLDPHLHLAGHRSGVGTPENWDEQNKKHQTNLDAIEKRLTCHIAGVKDALDVQLLVAQEGTFPAGAFVRLYHTSMDLESGRVTRGDGACATVLSNGGLVLPLPVQKSKFQQIEFDLLVVTWEKKKDAAGKEIQVPTPHFRAGIKLTGLPSRRTDLRGVDFEDKFALAYDETKGALLTFDAGFSSKQYSVLAVLPRSGKVAESTYAPDSSHELKVEGMDGADEVFVGLRPADKTKLEECILWQRVCFPASARASAQVSLADETVLARLKAIEKAQKEKIQVLVNEQLDAVGETFLRECEKALGEKRVGEDTNVHLPMTRAESALYVYTKASSSSSSDQERQTAAVSGAPLVPRYTNTEPDEIGNPDAPAGPDASVLGVALEGRAAHQVYGSFQGRARKGLSGFAQDDHEEATPTSTVQKSTHRAALLRTFPGLLDADTSTSIAPDARRDQLLAVADAIRCARRSIYIEGPFFEVYDRVPCDDPDKVFDAGKYNLAQLIHRRLLANPDLLLIVCLPQRIRHPWGDVAAGLLRKARVQALRTARYDGFEPQFVSAHGGKEKVYTQALPVHERVAVFHPLGFMGRPLDLVTSVVIVDDAWASVGNAGFRRRSLSFDSGLNVALTDLTLVEGAPKLVRELRVALMERALGLAKQTTRDDTARLRRFEDAFATVRGLCERRLATTMAAYDEAQTEGKLDGSVAQYFVNCRELVDPDGQNASSSYAAALTALWPLARLALKALGVLDLLREVKLTWKAPMAPRDTEVKFVIRMRRDREGAPATETAVKVKSTAEGFAAPLYLGQKVTYQVQVRYAATDGKQYASPWARTSGAATLADGTATLAVGTLVKVD
jgi:hypothetical protein